MAHYPYNHLDSLAERLQRLPHEEGLGWAPELRAVAERLAALAPALHAVAWLESDDLHRPGRLAEVQEVARQALPTGAVLEQLRQEAQEAQAALAEELKRVGL